MTAEDHAGEDRGDHHQMSLACWFPAFWRIQTARDAENHPGMLESAMSICGVGPPRCSRAAVVVGVPVRGNRSGPYLLNVTLAPCSVTSAIASLISPLTSDFRLPKTMSSSKCSFLRATALSIPISSFPPPGTGLQLIHVHRRPAGDFLLWILVRHAHVSISLSAVGRWSIYLLEPYMALQVRFRLEAAPYFSAALAHHQDEAILLLGSDIARVADRLRRCRIFVHQCASVHSAMLGLPILMSSLSCHLS